MRIFLFMLFLISLLITADMYIESKFMFYAWNRSLSHFRFFHSREKKKHAFFFSFVIFAKICVWFFLFSWACVCVVICMYRWKFYIWINLWRKHHYYHLWPVYASQINYNSNRHMHSTTVQQQHLKWVNRALTFDALSLTMRK